MYYYMQTFVTASSCKQMRLKELLPAKIIVLLCLVLLTSCGFKLRGAYQLPDAMQLTYIESASNSDLTRSLKRSLKSSNIKLATEKTEDAAVLKLSAESRSKRIVSVDSKGRAREYTLSYAVSFSVQTAGDFEIKNRTVNIDRDFVFDTEDVLGKSREESKLYEEMQQDLIRLILLRLQSKTQAAPIN